MRFDATVGDRTVKVDVRERDGGYEVELDGRRLEVGFAPAGDHFASLVVGHHSHDVAFGTTPQGYLIHLPTDSVLVAVSEAGLAARSAGAASSGPTRVCAPMPGRVVRVLAAEGRSVEAGEGLVVVEAMKMENELKAPRAGRVERIEVGEGQAVEAGALLLVVV